MLEIRIFCWIGVLGLYTGFGIAQARDVTFYGALTTDYIYRGVSLSDGHEAVQIGLDISSEMGLFGGVWVSTTDIDTADRNRPRELDFYIGYAKQFANDWSTSISVNQYTFPAQDGNVDYKYEEFSVLVGYRDRVWMELNHTNSLFGHDASARNVEILASWPLAASLSLTTGFGYAGVSEFAGNGYSYWQVGVSRPVGWASVDLRYHDTSNVPARISRAQLAEPRVVLAISAAF